MKQLNSIRWKTPQTARTTESVRWYTSYNAHITKKNLDSLLDRGKGIIRIADNQMHFVSGELRKTKFTRIKEGLHDQTSNNLSFNHSNSRVRLRIHCPWK